MITRKFAITMTLSAIALVGALSIAPSINAADAPQHINPLIDKLQKPGVLLTPNDWAFLDYEHGKPFSVADIRADLAELGKKRTATGQLETVPIVRLPADGDEQSRWMVKQTLDSGAFGIVFGHIESRAEALRAIENMRYPTQKGAPVYKPEGKRGYGPTLAPKYWGLSSGLEYFNNADVYPLNPKGNLLAIIMIETAEGVKHIDEITSTPGVGGILIGPSDLGVSLGVGPLYPKNAPETEAAIQTIVNSCKKYNVPCITLASTGPDEVKRRADQGFKALIVKIGLPQ